MNAQIDLFDEIIVDNFAGGGGASTGIELATGRTVAFAINHDPDAILMHKTNHPYTEHLQASVWDINPIEVCRGRPVGLAWFSPDCKHFSKAKGGKPVDKNVRGLAWVTIRWAASVKPRVIILENVEEFQTWGPLKALRDAETSRVYKMEDYINEDGEPDVKMVVSKRGEVVPFSKQVMVPDKARAGRTFKQFITALENLGYTIEFRELVAADYGAPTIRKRFFLVARCDGKPIVWPEPTHSKDGIGGKPKWRSAAEIIDWSLPCPSIFESKEQIKAQYGQTAVRPLANNTLKRVIRGIDKFTIKSGKPFIVQCNHGGADRLQNVEDSMPTVTGKHGYGIVTPSLMAIGQTGGGDRIRGADEPINTQVSKAETCLIMPNLIQYHSEQSDYVRGQDVNEPIMTVDSSNRYGLASAQLTKYFSVGDNAQAVNAPMHTATTKDREALTLAHITKYYGGVDGSAASVPLPTVTAIDHNSLTLAHVAEFKGQDKGQDCFSPLRTITASVGEFGTVYTTVEKYQSSADLKYWPQVRKLLNNYCDYSLADNEVLLIWINGIAYFISDIGLRMLTPKELYSAMGFPIDYIIDRDYLGNEYGKTKQVARCGNAVCPQLATAIVRANLPEWCSKNIRTMAEFEREVAV